MKYDVVEIFQSIQGEGEFMGTPCNFIRFAGCNLACPWCDTDWSDYGVLTTSQILENLDLEYSLIVLTGGEPTIQEDLRELVIAIRSYYSDNNEVAFVAIETNGTNDTRFLELQWITCSPKRENGYQIQTVARVNELKYVVDSEFDAAKAIPNMLRSNYLGKIWLQPESSDLKANMKKCYELAMADPRLRVGIQLHKILEVQ